MITNEESVARRAQRLGDYELLEKIADSERTESFLADQLSVKRQVILDRLKPEFSKDEQSVEAFFSDLKVKVSVDCPGVGLVYEAVRKEEAVYYTREHLKGETLEDYANKGHRLKPEQWIVIIKQIAEISIHYKDKGIATMPMAPHHVHLEKAHHVRLVNLAVSGPRNRSVATKDKQMLGMLIPDLLIPNLQAETRLRSLCGYMADLHRAEPLSWNQIQRLCLQVEDQLDAAKSVLITDPYANRMKWLRSLQQRKWFRVGLVGTLAALLGVLLWGFIKKGSKSQPTLARQLDQMIHVKAGQYVDQNGRKTELQAFWIDQHEVTIAEYAQFLKELSHLAKSQQRAFGHVQQPPTKNSYEPWDWKSLYTAAKNGEHYQGQPLSLNCPVINVDWWDAYAYAHWKNHRLPTQEEFYAAAIGTDPEIHTSAASSLISAGFGEVDRDKGDLSLSGVHGLAGNVREWTAGKRINPAYPMSPPETVICGGSFLNKGQGVKTRAWEKKKHRYGRDLGFRTVKDIPKHKNQ